MTKIFVAIAASAGLIIGYASGKLSDSADATPTNTGLTQNSDSDTIATLRRQLTAARAEIESFTAQAASAAQRDNNQTVFESLVVEPSVTDKPLKDLRGEDSSAKNRSAERFDDAMLALENGDLAGATQLLNELLASATNSEQKATVQEGLLSVLRASYQQQRASGEQTNEALWSLFEIHRLAPGPAVKSEIINLSQQAHAEAQNYLAQNDLLASADRLNSLVHLSRMVDYELIDDRGQPLGPAQFQAELQQIEASDDYLPRLQTRAENNLYGGDEATRSNVFWDYARLATLRGDNSLADPVFRGQFIQATTAHLNYLRDMNQAGEIRSRMDYIRYAFPQIASRPEISGFN